MINEAKTVIKAGWKVAKAKSPAILTGVGIGGYLACIPLTAHGVRKMDKLTKELDISGMTRKEKVKLAGKCYWGVGLCALGATAAVIAGQVESARRIGTLGAAFLSTQQELLANKETLKEVLGEKKAAVVEKAMDERKVTDIVDQRGTDEQCGYCADAGIHFIDMFTNEPFTSSFEAVRTAFTKLKEQLLLDDQACLNDLRDYLGLAHNDIGDMMFWCYSDCREAPEPVFGEPFELRGVMRIPLRYSVLPSQFQF